MRINTYITLFFIFFLVIVPVPSQAQQIAPERLEIYVQSDTLKVDVGIDSVFTQRHIDAIESGMTASILIQFRLLAPQNRTLFSPSIEKLLEHDIWEGQYHLIKYTPQPDTLTTDQFEVIRRICTQLQGFPIAPLPLPDQMLTLQMRLHIDPITPEQQERTRRWLKILRKGSLLEFFFSFEKPNPSTPWINLIQFRPSALPHLVQEVSP